MTPTSERYIRCPECGLMRSALADKCEHCGSTKVTGHLERTISAMREADRETK